MITTTLQKIRDCNPCADGYKKLVTTLGGCKTYGMDTPIALRTILDSNGLDDALWCLRSVDGYDREKRLFAVFCARQVQHLMTARSIAAIDTAESFANGLCTRVDLAAAWAEAIAAARAAAGDAARASTWAEAGASAWASAWAEAGAEARDAAIAAARAEARAASAWAEAGAEAIAAAGEIQKAEFIRVFCGE